MCTFIISNDPNRIQSIARTSEVGRRHIMPPSTRLGGGTPRVKEKNRTDISVPAQMEDYFKAGGPDNTSHIKVDGIDIIHNLLALSKSLVKQPVETDRYVFIFYGEAYDYPDHYACDTDYVIDLFLNDPLWYQTIDGEYSLIVYDKHEKMFNVYTDWWGTRTVTYTMIDFHGTSIWCLCNWFTGSSEPLKPNSHYKISLNGEIEHVSSSLVKFNLDQNNDSYDEWCELFVKAVGKRRHFFDGKDNRVGLLFSGGFDSSAVATALKLNKINAYTITDELARKVEPGNQDTRDFIAAYDNIEHIYFNGRVENMFAQFKHEGIRVCISGNGGDELTRYNSKRIGNKNYYKWVDGPVTFPWPEMYGFTWFNSIDQHQVRGLSYAIECRYPFSDKHCFQAFINISPNLKNKYPKGPIHHFLLSTGVPIPRDHVGFNVYHHYRSGSQSNRDFIDAMPEKKKIRVSLSRIHRSGVRK